MSKTSASVKLQWTALVVIVVAIIALVVLLFDQQREYRSHASAAGAGSSTMRGLPATASAASSAESQESVAAVTRAAQAVVNSDEDVVLSVLGDSTSDSASDWVYRWAQDLGQDATVVVRTWNPETGDWFPQTRQYGQGERTVIIWNGSESGATPEAPLAQGDLRQPEPVDLTILNYGHNGRADEVEQALAELLAAVQAGEGAPVVLTAQNPADGERAETSGANRALVEAAATKHGLPVIDVHAAFDDAESWKALLVDEIHPNDQGQQLWTDTVSAFFTR